MRNETRVMLTNNSIIQQLTTTTNFVPTLTDTWVDVRVLNVPTITRQYTGYVQVELVGNTNGARLGTDIQKWRLSYSDGSTTNEYSVVFTATPASPSQYFHTFRLLADTVISPGITTITLQCNSGSMSAANPLTVRAMSFFAPRILPLITQ